MPKIIHNKEKLIDEMLERIANGEPLRHICRDEHMPSWQAFYLWLDNDAEFYERFTRARIIGSHAIAQDCMDIADDSGLDASLDEKTGAIKIDGEAIQRAKLRVETRLKLLSKWFPQEYGDSKTLDHKSTDGSMTPAKIERHIIDDNPKD